jgi:hypothetical protein
MRMPFALMTGALISIGVWTSLARGGKDMSDKNKIIVERYENEFKNKANYAIVDELFAPDYKGWGLGPAPINRDMLKALGQQVGGAFGDPTVKVTLEDVLAAGDRVITRVSASGVHKGAFQGVPATNRPVKWSEIHIYRIKDGRIAESWSEVNFLMILTQIGAIPPPPAAR